MTGLNALFRPRSVAIIGASSDPNKVGGRPLAFLRRAGFAGAIHPVNPAASEVQGLRAFPTLASIGGEIDQAIVAVPAGHVGAAIADCIAANVSAVQIFSAGFGDGADHARVLSQAKQSGMRVLGPNSLGLFNTAAGFFGTFATALDGAWPKPGPIGVATQSGAFGSYFFGLAQRRGLGFSAFVATGNESDVDLADCIAWLVQDDATRLIVTALEGCRDGRKLAAALEDARRAGKPVLAMKVGSSVSGALAAATHTGALSGEDRVFDAVLRDCGAFRAESLGQLVDAAYLASTTPMPDSETLLVVTTSGGIGVLCADTAEASGLSLPPLSDDARAAIRAAVPLAEGQNPVDTSAGILGDLTLYASIAGQALADRPFGAVLCFMAHIARNPAHWAQLRAPLYALRARYPQRCFIAALLADDDITADLEAHGFAVFADPGHAVQAIAACKPRAAVALELAPTDDTPVLDTAPQDEKAAQDALAHLGIPFAPGRIVTTQAQAQAAADAIGYPVVLKVVSPDIAHKTEAGGVILDIADGDALGRALEKMTQSVARHAPQARIDGFLVARQLRGGIELLVGTRCDPVFGPVIAVGTGGIHAELFDDVALRLAPIDATSARDLLSRTRFADALCRGWRGARAADLDRVCELIARLSQIAWASRASIDSIDLNPVLALPDGVFALDALITPHGESR